MKVSGAGRVAVALLSLAMVGSSSFSAWAQGTQQNALSKEQAEAIAAKTKALIDRAQKDGNRPKYAQRALALYKAGEDLMKDGDYDEAVTIFGQARHLAREAWVPF